MSVLGREQPIRFMDGPLAGKVYESMDDLEQFSRVITVELPIFTARGFGYVSYSFGPDGNLYCGLLAPGDWEGTGPR